MYQATWIPEWVCRANEPIRLVKPHFTHVHGRKPSTIHCHSLRRTVRHMHIASFPTHSYAVYYCSIFDMLFMKCYSHCTSRSAWGPPSIFPAPTLPSSPSFYISDPFCILAILAGHHIVLKPRLKGGWETIRKCTFYTYLQGRLLQLARAGV